MSNEQLQKQIKQEAKNFAFFNYVSAAHNGTAVFDDIETWTDNAQVCYYSIVNYMTGKQVCWPYAEPTLPMKWQAAEQKIKELTQWKKEATALLDPLLEWGHAQKDIPLGGDITQEILRRAKLFGKYEKALREISRQCKIDEMDANDVDGDINEGYDAIINVAREALTPKTSSDDKAHG